MQNFDAYSLVRVSASFVDSTGAAVDPTAVLFKYQAAATGTITALTYGVDAALVKDSTGNYHVDVDTTPASGQWNWQFYSTGTGQDSTSGSFYVRPTQFGGTAPTLANTYVSSAVGGSGITVSPAATGDITISLSGNGLVTSITGTGNEIIASGATGNVTLSTPQAIGTASTPQFARLGLGIAASATFPLLVSATSVDVARFFSTAGACNIRIDAAASQNAEFSFYDNTTLKYQFGKDTGNGFFMWDQVNTRNFLSYSNSTGNLSLQPSGGHTVVEGVTSTGATGTGKFVFSTAPIFPTTVGVGVQSGVTGIINLVGLTSGTISITANDAAGTWTMKLPATAGSNNQVLATDGSGNLSWSSASGSAFPTFTPKATSFAAASNTAYWITAASVTATLPASPADGDFVCIADGAAVTVSTTVIARNGKTIMGLSSDLTVDVNNFQIVLIYRSATGDWRLAI